LNEYIATIDILAVGSFGRRPIAEKGYWVTEESKDCRSNQALNPGALDEKEMPSIDVMSVEGWPKNKKKK
jgi:hypothetical protein